MGGLGSDRLEDFELGSDRLGMADGLQFEDLSFTENQIWLGDELLATVANINTINLTSDDFTVA